MDLHLNNVTAPMLQTLRDAGVTKLSIGVQSFQEKYQGILLMEVYNVGFK